MGGGTPEEVNAILESKRKEVMSGRSLVESEEDMALVQLGIDPEERRAERKKESNSNNTSSSAKSRIEETKEKSPFVAEVIGDVCPEAEEDFEPEIVIETIFSEEENQNGDVEVVEVVVSALEVVSDEDVNGDVAELEA